MLTFRNSINDILVKKEIIMVLRHSNENLLIKCHLNDQDFLVI